MVTASRSRQALSPLPQNHSQPHVVPASSASRHTGTLRNKVAQANSASVVLRRICLADQPSAEMQPARPRGSLKRKKGASVPTPARIVLSPHLPREKPSSSASDLSDWSSLASLSPSSRSLSFSEEIEQRPVRPVQPSRRTSLQTSMHIMSLQDRTPPRSTNRSSSMQGVRRISARRTASREAERKPEPSAESAEDVVAEHERLITSAPTWQLRRLKKDELVQLNAECMWESTPSDLDLELLTKQDLVNNIITGRSRLDRTSSSPPPEDQSDPTPRKPSRRHSAAYRSETLQDNASFSDQSNEGGGEETEAEQARAATILSTRSTQRRPIMLRRMDSSSFDDFEPVKAATPPRRQLRDRSSLFGAAARRLRRANGSEVLSGASSSSIFGGRSSRASIGSPFLAPRNHFVAASPIRTRSRTRSTLATSSTHRKGLRTTAPLEESRQVDLMATPKLTRSRARRAQKVVKFKGLTPARPKSDSDLDNDWLEEGSLTSLSSSASDEDPDAHYDADSGSANGSDSGRDVRGAFFDNVSAHAEADDQDTSEDDHDSPVKFRKLRNGKVRSVLPAPAVNEIDDVHMDSDHEGDDVANDDEQAPEVAMKQPTTAILARLRKPQLEQLCQARLIDVDMDDKKADLSRKLLAWHEEQQIENELSDSDLSTATATQADIEAAPQTTKARRSPSLDSDLPLMLRAPRVHSNKLPTPPLTSHNEEANAPQTGDGVDELNGLDLESLNLVDKEIPPSKLEKLEKIGSGGFKDVYIGKYHISKTRVSKVAIADIRDQLTEMDIKELSLLRDLRHENIVRFIGVSIPDNPRNVPCMIVSELCSNGDLFDYIRNTSAPSDAEVFRILLETARGLEYLHTRTPAITHRDCKSTNVLITRGRTAKINDFGLARVKNSSRSMMKSLVGTVNWQAVELWVPKPHYNEKVDVWSAAMTFWETLQWHQPEKKYPFQGMNEHQIYQDVGQKQKRPSTVAIRRQFGPEIVELLDRMWDQTPKARPSMTQVCKELEELVKMKKIAAKSKY